MDIQFKTLLKVRTIDQLIEIMKLNKQLEQDSIIEVMDIIDPRSIDIELRKFYLYSCCMSDRSDLIRKYATPNLDPSYYFDCFQVYIDNGPPETATTILELMKTYTDYPIKDLAIDMMIARQELIIEVVKFLKRDEIKKKTIKKRELKRKVMEVAEEISDTEDEVSTGFNKYNDSELSYDSLDDSDFSD